MYVFAKKNVAIKRFIKTHFACHCVRAKDIYCTYNGIWFINRLVYLKRDLVQFINRFLYMLHLLEMFYLHIEMFEHSTLNQRYFNF